MAGHPEALIMPRGRVKQGHTLDLFKDYQPQPVVDRFADEEVRAFSLRGRMSKAVAKTLEDSGMQRDEVAQAMSELLGEKITDSTLDAYASQAREQHTITAVRLAALAKVTGDSRALNTLLAEFGLIAVPAKYEALLRREAAREARERFEREEQAADAEWRAKR
jgi:hypothetical protein